MDKEEGQGRAEQARGGGGRDGLSEVRDAKRKTQDSVACFAQEAAVQEGELLFGRRSSQVRCEATTRAFARTSHTESAPGP